MYISSFFVKGYRSFRDTVTLRDLGAIVVCYGLNNAGKTNLIKAIDLFHRLMSLELDRLLDPAARDAAAFYTEFGQDPWMFHIPGDDVVEVGGQIASIPGEDAIDIRFRITRVGAGIAITLTEWAGVAGEPALTRAKSAWQAWREAQGQPEPGWQATESEQATFQAYVDATASRWNEISNLWSGQVSAPGMTIHLPVNVGPASRQLRGRFAQLTRSVDLKRRKQAQWALDRFAEVVPGLPKGRLEAIESASLLTVGGPDDSDFGWVSEEAIIPLDQLGSGAQAVFALLAALALADKRVVALEEPESSLNARIQGLLADAILASVGAEFSLVQLFIATHSPVFARSGCDIWLLEQERGDLRVTRERAAHIVDLTAPPAPQESGRRTRTASLLDYDGGVMLPDHVLNQLESSKGHFVYFVPAPSGGFRILSSHEMGDLLGENDP